MSYGFDVISLGPTDHPEVGDEAPSFTRPLVNAEYWEDTALSELLGDDPIVLVFMTMDGDFPATYVWNEIRDRRWDNLATVVGLSISSPYEHKAFIRERNIEDRGFRFFSDPKNGVAEAWGIDHDLDDMTGISEPRPAIFVLDEAGIVEYAWVATDWPEFPDYDEVEEHLKRR